MQLLYRINRTGTTVVVATHDNAMVDRMRRRVIEVSSGRIVRDEQAGGYRPASAARPRASSARCWREGLGVRLGFFLREALRALRRNAVPSFAAMATVLVTVLVLGVFIPVVQATTGAANDVRAKVLVDVYLKPDATEADVERVRGDHRGRHAGRRQRRVHLQGAGAHARSARRGRGEFYDLLGSNPLPDLLRVTPDAARRTSSQVRDALAPVSPSGAAHRRRPLDRRGQGPQGATRTRSSPPRAW